MLLILAGISIQMLTGDNGILTRAGDAKEKTERAEIIENVRMDILEMQATNKNGTISKAQLEKVLLKYFDEKEVKELEIPEDVSTSTKELTSKKGNYKIQLSELYIGKLLKESLVAGLYNADNNEMIYTWDDMLELGNIINVNDGVITRNAFNVGDIKVKLIIKDGITGISSLAGIPQLVEIELPESITEIKDNAFGGDQNLRKLKIPDKVSVLPNISSLTGLEELEIGDGVSSISTLEKLTKLKILKLGDGITSIPDRCCQSLNSLETLELGNNVTSIGMYAFDHCTKLKDFKFPKSLKSIGQGAFCACGSLTHVNLNKIKLTSFGKLAFASCDGLIYVDSDTDIPELAFVSCKNLDAVLFHGENIGEKAFAGCEAMTTTYFSLSTKTIGLSAFEGCQSLKSTNYVGTPNDWNKIDIAAGNDNLNVKEGINYRSPRICL